MIFQLNNSVDCCWELYYWPTRASEQNSNKHRTEHKNLEHWRQRQNFKFRSLWSTWPTSNFFCSKSLWGFLRLQRSGACPPKGCVHQMTDQHLGIKAQPFWPNSGQFWWDLSVTDLPAWLKEALQWPLTWFNISYLILLSFLFQRSWFLINNLQAKLHLSIYIQKCQTRTHSGSGLRTGAMRDVGDGPQTHCTQVIHSICFSNFLPSCDFSIAISQLENMK